ncbi:MAG: hypothetical protein KDA53_07690 [Hyphomonas sp.]|nr:hypothetical protein [Hyphomonas sp.]
MIRIRHLISGPALALLSACATGSSDKPPPTPDGPLASLPAQNLAAGDCGLFLWSVQAPRRLIFFRRAGETDALMALGSETMTVSSQQESGRVFGQFMTDVTYSADNADMVSVSLVPGETVEDGQRTQSARIIVRTKTDWETVIPAAGLMACVPADAEQSSPAG